MSTTVRSAIEDELVTLLAPLKLVSLGGSAGGYLRALTVYCGPLEGAEVDEVKDAIVGRTPCVLLRSGDASLECISVERSRNLRNLDIDVLACSGNLRSFSARARGGTSGEDPGVYQILEDLHEILAGYESTVTGVGTYQPTGESVQYQLADLCVWSARYTVQTNVNRPAATGVEDLEEIHVEHNLDDSEAVNPVVEGDITLTPPGA
ncbi:MAG: hypothetical protein V2A73_14780 [Pseudomonadota bacterium]